MERISLVDTAKLVRQALKGAFPSTTFSVRSKSYSGGASINIGWTDGPTSSQVEAITAKYEGADFDAMVDLKTHKDGMLNGRPVHFGADYVVTNRHYSRQFMELAAATVARRRGVDAPRIIEDKWYTRFDEADPAFYTPLTPGCYDSMRDLVWRYMQETPGGAP